MSSAEDHERRKREEANMLPKGELICPKCKGTVFAGLQYQGTSQDYDGISEWICQGCSTHYGRWTRQELIAGELERRYGVGRYD